jgi:hypothetical protein
MTYFTTAIDAALNSAKITDAEFVRVTVYNPLSSSVTPFTYCLSNSYKTETFSSNNFSGSFVALGGLVNISGHQRDLSVTAFDTQITLIGIDQTQIKNILEVGWNEDTPPTYHAGLKGSKIEIWRGFYDANYNLIDTPQLRYTGITTSYHITEDRQSQVDTFSLTIQCSSYKTVLENRFSGRHTNGASWNNNVLPLYDGNGNPTNTNYDSSMDRVQAIHNTTFNFGLPV